MPQNGLIFKIVPLFVGSTNQSVKGNSLPGVAGILLRNGVSVARARYSATFQFGNNPGFYSDLLKLSLQKMDLLDLCQVMDCLI